jgi:hypothetical protein
VVDAYDVKIAEISQPASPAPTPEGRETAATKALEWAESAGSRTEASERTDLSAHIRENLAKRAVRDMGLAKGYLEQAIREAKAETLREVRAEMDAWRDIEARERPAYPALDVLRVVINSLDCKLFALTGGTEEP